MQNVIVTINDDNKFDERGESLDKFNSTETTIYVDGELHTFKRIGGTAYRKPEYVGRSFKGYIDSLGFVGISTDRNCNPIEIFDEKPKQR